MCKRGLDKSRLLRYNLFSLSKELCDFEQKKHL